ncbi:hypothetical protein LNQ49_09050 [Flavobacterium sp. F-65]|uniref:Uncharacterized protein n=1 Tax=Flavobacterium pisciphilum TaxID=2893755 RepID=A0ABS8MSG9_9FLAO|nr:hypothetical protein [Flavobacterium sp. F-65]MCC9071725.1 hypothetical protein [Flavobacterium sp. F-65]
MLRLDKLLWLICIVVILEAFLINTIISPSMLPNYTVSLSGDLLGETKILGFYQRPYSIGSNSTITSTLIMVLVFYVFGFSKVKNMKKSNKLLFISVFTVIIVGSGTGYMLLMLFAVYKIGPFKNWLSGIVSFLVVLLFWYLIFVLDVGSIQGLERVSSLYFDFLYDFKIMQIDDVIFELKSEKFQLLIGRHFENVKDLIVWGDFAWLNLFESTGYIGLCITIIIFVFKINRYNYIPVLVFLLGAMHYGAIYTLPGQLIFGYFISANFKNNEKRGGDLISSSI